MKMSKWLLLLAFVCSIGQAACPSSSACLSWRASTRWLDINGVDAGPITSEVTYILYRGDFAIGSTKLLAIIFGPEPVGNQCYRVIAMAEGKTSSFSTQTCKLIRPAAPTEGAIEAPTDGSIENRR
jgi:hypothetical protein